MHVVIIGAYGSAGVAAAERLSERVGEELDRLTLVDDGDPGGGLCILRGCMPSKEVLSAAAHRYQARHDSRLVGDAPELNLDRVVARKDRHVESFAAHRRSAVHSIAEGDGVEFVHGTGRFVDDRRIRVEPTDGSDALEIDADYVVVATGSSVHVPDLEGLDEVEYLTSADVLDATELSDSSVVMGFGYVGIELVPYLAEAGVDLTVIEHDERPLDEADPAFGDELLDLYREEWGVEILTRTYERAIEPTDDGGVRLHVERDGEAVERDDGTTGSDDADSHEETIEADDLFLFTGRRPALDGLGLEHTALSYGEGWVEDTMRARGDERTYVVGDVNDKEPILHVAKEQGYVAADNVLADVRGDPPEIYQPLHHHVMFSGAGVYPFVRVGHSRRTAEERGLDYVAVAREAEDDGVFATKDVAKGRAELVVDATDGTVLGYQGLHYHADVMAKTMQVVIERRMDVRDLPDRAYHPTTPEILDGLFREATAQLD